jgi:hypothetical protein
MPRQPEEEKKPYNPFAMATGIAGRSLPDHKCAAVFAAFGRRTDFLGGSVTVSVETIVAETNLCERNVKTAIKQLESLGRITRKRRARHEVTGGRQSSVTTCHCTEAELQAAGANQKNWYERGGKPGLAKVHHDAPNPTKVQRALNEVKKAPKVHFRKSQGANPAEPKCILTRAKVHPDAREPLEVEPLRAEPREAEPLQVSDASSLRSPLTTKSKATSTPGAAHINPRVPVEEKPSKGSVRPPKYGLPAYIAKAKKCEQMSYGTGEDGEDVPCGGIAVPNYRYCKSCLEAHQEFCRKHPESTDPDSALDKPIARGALA